MIGEGAKPLQSRNNGNDMLEEYIAVDLETTGLSPKKDCIIEIGAAHVQNGKSVGRFSTLIKPKCMIPERIVTLTGITEQMTADAPTFQELLPELMAFFGELPLVGHNVLFDYSFLKKEFVNRGLPFEKYGVDTLKLCRQFLPAEQKKNLAEVCSCLHIAPANYHRALADAESAGYVLEVLKNRYMAGHVEAFTPKLLNFTIKREHKIQIRQKQYLIDFAKWHKIDVPVDIDALTRSEASRLLDQWIGMYGRIAGHPKR